VWWVPNREQAEQGDLAILPQTPDASAYRAAKRAARGDAAPEVAPGFTAALGAGVRRTLLDQLGPEEAERLHELDLDALAMALPPDLVVVKVDRSGSAPRDWLCYVHVWLPSGWQPERAVGKSFREIHAPVPIVAPEHREAGAGVFAKMLATSEPIPRYRFVWGLQSHPKLDGHPLRSPRMAFNGSDLWLRVERQVLLPLPEHDALVFLIHPYVDRVDDLTAEQGRGLLEAFRALQRRGDAVLAYKLGPGYASEGPRIERFLAGRFG